MSKIEAKPKDATGFRDLGVELKGSAEDGHEVVMSRDGALRDVFATDCPFQAKTFLSHCLKVLNGTEAGDAGDTNDERGFMLSIVNDIAPRDAIERMLAVQMAATHVATIRQGRRMAFADQLPQFDSHERAYNKLSRTFAAQVEALRKHRTGGKQTVTVQHVNVEDGGQAIVGSVQHGGAATHE